MIEGPPGFEDFRPPISPPFIPQARDHQHHRRPRETAKNADGHTPGTCRVRVIL